MYSQHVMNIRIRQSTVCKVLGDAILSAQLVPGHMHVHIKCVNAADLLHSSGACLQTSIHVPEPKIEANENSPLEVVSHVAEI